MKGSDPEALRFLPQDVSHPATHFLGGPVGECHRQDAVWRDATGSHEVAEPRGQYPGLSGACTCQNEQRPPAMLDGIALGVVERNAGHDDLLGREARKTAPSGDGRNSRLPPCTSSTIRR